MSLIDLFIKYSRGYIKDEKQAKYAMLGFSLLLIILSIFFFRASTQDNFTPNDHWNFKRTTR